MNAPRWWDIARMRLRTLTRRHRVESELDRELRFHLDQGIAENLARGMTAAERRLAELRSIGGVAQIQEECREMRRTQHLETLWNDLRYSVRTLGKTPGFAVVIVLTLALAIGANSAIFSVIDGVLLRPLPYPQADRIVRIFYNNDSYAKFPMNWFDFRDFRARNHSFGCMALMTRSDVQLSGEGEPVKLTGFRVTAGFFRVLGLQPARGREFTTGSSPA